jgi:predicted nucleic acid-binding protein
VLVAITDASPLIFLSRLHRLELLERFARVLIPIQVLSEIQEGIAKDPESVNQVARYLTRHGVERREVDVPTAFHPDLGSGERAGIYLATQVKDTVFLVDEKRARTIARASGLRTRSTVFLLLDALESGKMSKGEFQRDLDRLLRLNYYISTHMYGRVTDLVRRL